MFNFFIRVLAVFNAILVSAKIILKKFSNFLIDFYLFLQKMLSSLLFFDYDCRAFLNSSFCSDLFITPRRRTTLVCKKNCLMCVSKLYGWKFWCKIDKLQKYISLWQCDERATYSLALHSDNYQVFSQTVSALVLESSQDVSTRLHNFVLGQNCFECSKFDCFRSDNCSFSCF